MEYNIHSDVVEAHVGLLQLLCCTYIYSITVEESLRGQNVLLIH